MTWYEYLLEQLRKMNSINPDQEWMKKVLGHAKYIIKTNLGIQFQASYFYGYTRSLAVNQDEELKVSKRKVKKIKLKKDKSGSKSVRILNNSTRDTIDINKTNHTLDQQEELKL